MPACTEMVYSKELERDVTTTAMAKALLRLKTLASFLHRIWSVYVRRTNKGCYVLAMSKMFLFWAKTGKHLILSSFWHKTEDIPFWVWYGYGSHLKASFFQHRIWAVKQGKSYLHGIVSSFFYKKIKQARVPTFVWLFRDDATTSKGPRCDEGTNFTTLTQFRGSSAEACPYMWFVYVTVNWIKSQWGVKHDFSNIVGMRQTLISWFKMDFPLL